MKNQIHGGKIGPSQPCRKTVVITAHTAKACTNSPRKNSENFMPEYSM